jgi:hypothetical protein
MISTITNGFKGSRSGKATLRAGSNEANGVLAFEQAGKGVSFCGVTVLSANANFSQARIVA